jgi:hypothetical protein
MKPLFGLVLFIICFSSSCTKKSEPKEPTQYLDLIPIGTFDEESHGVFLTEAKIAVDMSEVYVALSHQGLLLKTDSLLNPISQIDGRDSFPDFEFPAHMKVKDSLLFVEDLASQQLFVLQKGNFKLKDVIKFPLPSMGIGIDIAKDNSLVFSSFPEPENTGLVKWDYTANRTITSKAFFPHEGKLRLSDQVRLGCFCQNGELWSLGRFLPFVEQFDEYGVSKTQYDLSAFQPIKQAFDRLIEKRKQIPDFETSRISQNIVTSLECFEDKLLVGFTDLVGLDRSNVRHLLLFSVNDTDIRLEKILRLRTGNDDEMYHFQTVAYNPKTSLLYAQGSETNRIYVFRVVL